MVDSTLPKGQMRQPEVDSRRRPDQPNSPRHASLKAAWKEGQRWECLVEGCSIWVLVGKSGYAEPLWDHFEEYREVPRA